MSSPQIEQIRAKAEQGQPDAQFLLSQSCHKNKEYDEMVYWLQQASASDHPDSLEAYGHCHEKGLGVRQDFATAVAHYDKAIQGGATQAAYRKADLMYRSKRGPDNEAHIRDLLITAAAAGGVVALRTIGYLAMQDESSMSLAVSCLRQAAQADDPVSRSNLDWCLSQGFDAPSSSPGDEPVGFDTAFSLYPESSQVNKNVLSSDPAITVFEHVLTAADCAYLIFVSGPHMQRADVIDPTSQQAGMISDVRTNLSTYLPFGLVDIISRYIELKIIRATGEDLAQSEPMSILCYSPGEYYKPHVDYFNPNLTVSQGLMEDGGQRTASAITYLCEPSAGGGTTFPRLKLAAQAKLGSTLWFRNCVKEDQVDDRTLHAGDTVESGEKWVMTKWFRERPTRYLEY